MMVFRRAGFVESTKGKHGGYVLARPPQNITVGEVIRAVDGPLAPVATAAEIEKRIQRNDRHAGLYSVLLEVRNAISEILDKETLADVCEKTLELARSKSTSQMYYI
jgi:Rrf2 family protein